MQLPPLHNILATQSQPHYSQQVLRTDLCLNTSRWLMASLHSLGLWHRVWPQHSFKDEQYETATRCVAKSAKEIKIVQEWEENLLPHMRPAAELLWGQGPRWTWLRCCIFCPTSVVQSLVFVSRYPQGQVDLVFSESQAPGLRCLLEKILDLPCPSAGQGGPESLSSQQPNLWPPWGRWAICPSP